VDSPHGDWNASEGSAACLRDRVVERLSRLPKVLVRSPRTWYRLMVALPFRRDFEITIASEVYAGPKRAAVT
jgi:hypothetical protein